MALGTFEFAAIFLLGLWGRGTVEAAGFAVVLHALLYLPPILVAMIFLPQEGLFSLKRLTKMVTGASQEHPQTTQVEQVFNGINH